MSKNNITTGEYAKACVEVAKELGTPVVDLYSEMMKLSVGVIHFFINTANVFIQFYQLLKYFMHMHL